MDDRGHTRVVYVANSSAGWLVWLLGWSEKEKVEEVQEVHGMLNARKF